MAHITFVHGIGNKPKAEVLHQIWREALASAAGVDLDALQVSSTMVYWADVVHTDTLKDTDSAFLPDEEAAEKAAGDVFPPVEVPLPADASEAMFTAMLAAKVGGAMVFDQVEQVGLLPFSLPDGLKKWLLQNFLRDAHHYLYNVTCTPRPGETYQVRNEVRRRFVAAMAEAPAGPHLVIGHSLGSVIAYDCFKNLADCGGADGMISIGSPLGLSELQELLGPGYSKQDGYPTGRIALGWHNFADRCDPICGLDVKLAGDYRRSGQPVIEDRIVDNGGGNRHAALRYLRQPDLRTSVRHFLGL